MIKLSLYITKLNTNLRYHIRGYCSRFLRRKIEHKQSSMHFIAHKIKSGHQITTKHAYNQYAHGSNFYITIGNA